MNSRKPFIAGNWKMYKTCSEAVETAKQLLGLTNGVKNVDIMIAPSFTSLFSVSEVIKDSNILLSSQNIFWEKEGAFTGEISKDMLISCGCQCVIIGHSERRQFFSETNQTVNKKIDAVIKADLIPILCIGESESERDSNKTFDVLDNQLKEGLEGLKDLQKLIIAYEPIWAIGTGKIATKEQAQEVHNFLRNAIKKSFGNDLAESMRILYGGSVKPDNIDQLMAMPDIDGALVGGASLDAETFSKIVKF
mmetsp:Transcript_21730/g.10171  ORF Transcript_21730/g.10171 Transcript_21730/m.10171 type:complete len:250 (-) Transcript_21730:4326-5075(-)